jgi:hypothetical protein
MTDPACPQKRPTGGVCSLRSLQDVQFVRQYFQDFLIVNRLMFFELRGSILIASDMGAVAGVGMALAYGMSARG